MFFNFKLQLNILPTRLLFYRNRNVPFSTISTFGKSLCTKITVNVKFAKACKQLVHSLNDVDFGASY